jgi:hypothetical protein
MGNDPERGILQREDAAFCVSRHPGVGGGALAG